MAGLVSLLDKNHNTLVEEIWQELEIDCALKEVSIDMLPHFSWHVADAYDWEALERTVQELAPTLQPFTVLANGLGVFTATSPVVYAPIVRTKAISELHQIIWERLASISTNPIAYYGPSRWMPHITLAYGDVDAKKLPCLMDKLAFKPISWEIDIDNFTLIYKSEDALGYTRYQFMSGEKETGSTTHP